MNPVLITIGACEIGFWVFVVAGLALRYLARRTRASSIVLACVPLVDLVLLVAVAVDLARGGDVEFAHRLAPIYLGGTLMFGHRMIAWADARFAYRFADGPAPVPVPKSGPLRLRHEWADFGRWVGAVAVAVVITAALGYTVADSVQRRELFDAFGTLGVVTVIWFVSGPLWYTLAQRDRAV